jgi:Transposase and inactivated derivatives
VPRRPRLELPGIPLHITQRGVNRAAIFVDDEDRRHYLALLREEIARARIALHAYVLMGNHVHLLACADDVGVISHAMRRHGQCYVQAFNRRHGRTGTLWEGRFKSCLVDSDRYLLTVYRYIELNPVRAAMVATPEAHRWSSVHANLGLCADALVTPHDVFVRLGPDVVSRAASYRAWLYAPLVPKDLQAVRDHLRQERALGDTRFQAMVEKALNRCARVRPPGRQKRAKATRVV